MHYFLTGATGFIGGRIARQLVEDGHTVTALIRDPARASGLRALGVQLAQGDITEKDSLYAAMRGAEGLFHVAGWYKLGRRNREMCERVNVEGTRNVLEVMRDLEIPKGVYTSTLAVFSDTHGRLVDETFRYTGPHLSAYDGTKAEAHYLVAEPMMKAGLPLVIVMPGLVYGPGDSSPIGQTLAAYLKRRLPFLPAGSSFCWAHVDDIARAHLLAMEKGCPGESYTIAGPPYRLDAVLSLAEQITGIPAPRLRVPPGVMRASAALVGAVETLVPLPEAYTADALRSSAGVSYLGNNAKARRELGYEPRPIEIGLRETLQAMQEQLRKE